MPDQEADQKPITSPISQVQEDLLLELFLSLSMADRRKVIKYCRDLLKQAESSAATD